MSGLAVGTPAILSSALNYPYEMLDGDTIKILAGTAKYQYIAYKNNQIIQPNSGVVTLDGCIDINGTGNEIKDIRVTNSQFTDRDSDPLVNGGITKGIRINGAGNKATDLIIYDTQNSLYIADITTGTTTIDGLIILHNGWLDPITGVHGHGIYLHGGNTVIKNCIIYCNSSNGIQVYGLVNHDNITLQNNICFATHEMWRTPGDYGMNYILSLGANAILQNNCSYSVLGSRRANEISQLGDGTLTNNYLVEGIFAYNPALWAVNSGNVLAAETTNVVKSFAIRGRLHVAIYNWELLDSVTVDVSSVFSPGASVTVANVEDYFTDVDTMVVSGGGTITIDMRAASHTVGTPQGLASPPVTMFPEFGCFVIRAA